MRDSRRLKPALYDEVLSRRLKPALYDEVQPALYGPAGPDGNVARTL